MLRREHLEKFLIAVPIFFFFFYFSYFYVTRDSISETSTNSILTRGVRSRSKIARSIQDVWGESKLQAFRSVSRFHFVVFFLFLSFFFFVLSSLDFIQARELPFLLRFDSSASEHSAFFSFRYEPTLHLSVLSDKSVFVAVSTKFHAREKKSGSDTYPFLFHPISVGFSDRSLRTTE